MRAFEFRDLRYASRTVGFVFYAFWTLVFCSWAFYREEFLKANRELEHNSGIPDLSGYSALKADLIVLQEGLSRGNSYDHYKFYEYLYGEGKLINTIYNAEPRTIKTKTAASIPVLFITGAMNNTNLYLHVSVTKKIHEMSQRKSFRYFVLDLQGEDGFCSGTAAWNEHNALLAALRWIDSMFARSPILVGHHFGAPLILSALPVFYAKRTADMPDMVIFSSPNGQMNNLVLDMETRAYYKNATDAWNKLYVIDWQGMGVVNIGTGDGKPLEFRMVQQFGGDHVTRVRFDDIGDLEQGGLDTTLVLSAFTYHDHLSRLLTFYEEEKKDSNWQRTGRQIALEFYRSFFANKKEHFARQGSEEDFVQGQIELRTGEKHVLKVETKFLRFDVKLRRGEWIGVSIRSRNCVRKVSTVRRKHHVSVKEPLRRMEVEQLIELSILDATPLEPIRLIVEMVMRGAGDVCDVTVQTTSSWFHYGHRFWPALIVQRQQYTIGGLLMWTWLQMFEAEKRKRRFSWQFQMTFGTLMLALYHSFDTVGVPAAVGFITGGSVVLYLFLFVGAVNWLSVNPKKELMPRRFFTFPAWLRCLVFGATSSKYPYATLASMALLEPVTLNDKFLLSSWPIFLPFCEPYLDRPDYERWPTLNRVTPMIVLIIAGDWRIGSWKMRAPRVSYHIAVAAATIFSIVACHESPLEVHLLVHMFVSMLNRHSEHHYPAEWFEKRPSRVVLELAYQAQEAEEERRMEKLRKRIAVLERARRAKLGLPPDSSDDDSDGSDAE